MMIKNHHGNIRSLYQKEQQRQCRGERVVLMVVEAETGLAASAVSSASVFPSAADQQPQRVQQTRQASVPGHAAVHCDWLSVLTLSPA